MKYWNASTRPEYNPNTFTLLQFLSDNNLLRKKRQTYAAIGAGVGSAFGPVGGVVGALIGLAVDLCIFFCSELIN